MKRSFDTVVVGGGVMGLCAAWHLGRMGHRVAVVERFRIGHVRGSSHGTSRVGRAAYADPAWAAFAIEALGDGWGLLERASGNRLVDRQAVVLFGPPTGPIQSFAKATEGLDGIAPIRVEEARHRWPQLCFDDDDLVLEDKTGGVIRAADALDALQRLIVEEGGRLFEASTVLRVNTGGNEVVLETERGVISCNRAVIAAGPWTQHLFPFLAPALTVVRQNLAFAEVTSPTAPEDFPVWAHIGARFHYGLPAVQRQGPKIAEHVVAGDPADARRFVSTATRAAERHLLDASTARFSDPTIRLSCTETCLYTVTHNEDFLLDLHPADRRIAIGAGFSGHGFKFAPLIGRILAELASRGECSLASWQTLRPRLSIGTHLRVAEARQG